MESVLFDKAVCFARFLDEHELPSFVMPMSNSDKLKIFALYKQVTAGQCCGQRPSFFDLQGRYQYDAWKELGDMSQATAAAQYIERVLAYALAIKTVYKNDELQSMDMRDQSLLGGLIERIDELKADCATLWPARYGHLRITDVPDATEDGYGREEAAGYEIKANGGFSSPLALADEMRIPISTNIAGLIGVSNSSAVSTPATDVEADAEEDPLQVKEPRETQSPDQAFRRPVPIGPIADEENVYEAAVLRRLDNIQSCLDQLEARMSLIEDAKIQWWQFVCRVAFSVGAIGCCSAIVFGFRAIFNRIKS